MVSKASRSPHTSRLPFQIREEKDTRQNLSQMSLCPRAPFTPTHSSYLPPKCPHTVEHPLDGARGLCALASSAGVGEDTPWTPHLLLTSWGIITEGSSPQGTQSITCSAAPTMSSASPGTCGFEQPFPSSGGRRSKKWSLLPDFQKFPLLPACQAREAQATAPNPCCILYSHQ